MKKINCLVYDDEPEVVKDLIEQHINLSDYKNKIDFHFEDASKYNVFELGEDVPVEKLSKDMDFWIIDARNNKESSASHSARQIHEKLFSKSFPHCILTSDIDFIDPATSKVLHHVKKFLKDGSDDEGIPKMLEYINSYSYFHFVDAILEEKSSYADYINNDIKVILLSYLNDSPVANLSHDLIEDFYNNTCDFLQHIGFVPSSFKDKGRMIDFLQNPRLTYKYSAIKFIKDSRDTDFFKIINKQDVTYIEFTPFLIEHKLSTPKEIPEKKFEYLNSFKSTLIGSYLNILYESRHKLSHKIDLNYKPSNNNKVLFESIISILDFINKIVEVQNFLKSS
tara:strand:- start:909 stop:1922 length:1014 start_codon:yes stop_codon:yes gene_type:complete